MFIPLIRILLIISAYLLVCALGYLGFATYQNNLTGWFLILTAFSYGLGGPYLLLTHLRNEKVIRQESKDLSFWRIIPGFLVVFYAPPLEYILLDKLLPRNSWMQILGLALIALSLFLFSWARLALRGMYSGRLRVKVGDKLIQDGPYHFIWHPAYAAYILMSFGIAVGFSSLVGLLAIPLLLIPGLIFRMNVEEKILFAEYGVQYDHYKEVTKRIIPGIW